MTLIETNYSIEEEKRKERERIMQEQERRKEREILLQDLGYWKGYSEALDGIFNLIFNKNKND